MDLEGSYVNVCGADRRTIADMASRIYCEMIVYHPDIASREQAVATALDLFARVKLAMKGQA